MAIIYNGLSSTDYLPGKKENTIFGMGRIWDESKNLTIAEKFAPEVKWPIKIAGNTIHPDTATEHPIQNVILPGHLCKEDLKKELSEAAIFIFPAFYEPFGLSILEAAYSGCALVLSDIPTLREIWHDSALYVKPNDISGWKNTLNLLIEDEFLRRQLTIKAFARAHLFDTGTTVRKYLRLYQQMKKLKTASYEN